MINRDFTSQFEIYTIKNGVLYYRDETVKCGTIERNCMNDIIFIEKNITCKCSDECYKKMFNKPYITSYTYVTSDFDNNVINVGKNKHSDTYLRIKSDIYTIRLIFDDNVNMDMDQYEEVIINLSTLKNSEIKVILLKNHVRQSSQAEILEINDIEENTFFKSYKYIMLYISLFIIGLLIIYFVLSNVTFIVKLILTAIVTTLLYKIFSTML